MSAIIDIVLACGAAIIILGLAYACLQTRCQCRHCQTQRACASTSAATPAAGVDGPAGSTGTTPPPLGMVPPLTPPGSGGRPVLPHSTADPGPSGSAA